MRHWRWIIYPILCLAGLALAIQLAVNHFLVKTGTCDPVRAATRVVVLHVSASNREITDPQQIRQLMDFVNARREVSVTLADEPIERITAVFDNNGSFVEAIGAGPNFFNVRSRNWKGTRPANRAELQEFKRLIGGIDENLSDPLPLSP
jgi:hypothetical protein